MATKKPTPPLVVTTLKHEGATRKNIPTAEFQSVMAEDEQSPRPVAYGRSGSRGLEEEKAARNRDLDPQLVWRGKDEQDWSNLIVQAPPLYIQEKVHPKVLIDDLRRFSPPSPAGGRGDGGEGSQPDLFADFNGLPSEDARTEFYQHDARWANRMILGDSLQVMASLAEREGLRGKVQCIYFDPPYGIKFNSNFQWSTTSRDVKDGNAQHITREPEQVKAFRDTWRDGIHSYLTYLRDRLTVARDLLAESGSIFVQIGDENVHRVRAVMDEVFGEENCVSQITFKKSSSATERYLSSTSDYIVWYAKDANRLKYRPVKASREIGGDGGEAYRLIEFMPGHWRTLSAEDLLVVSKAPDKFRVFRLQILTSQRQGRDTSETGVMSFPYSYYGAEYRPSKGRGWTTTREGMDRLSKAGRIGAAGSTINYKRYFADSPSFPIYNIWDDTQSGSSMEKTYVVQTTTKVIERCLLMATNPGDLVLDPTCGSGTTAYVAEQWGRRWITIDTSRVALALARARIMGARYPYYLLADSREGQKKEAEVTRTVPSSAPVHGDVRQGFVYERVPHITLKSIANNAEIDVIWEKWQEKLEPLREQLNVALGRDPLTPDPSPARGEGSESPASLAGEESVEVFPSPLAGEGGAKRRVRGCQAWQEWEIPREADKTWPEAARQLHAQWWQARIARQKEIDASIAAKAEFEFLYDKPYPDNKKIRVAGPFTVESLSPHRVLAVGADDELIDPATPKVMEPEAKYNAERNFVQIILENLKTAGVQQAHKQDKISFTSLTPWPGDLVCAEGRYAEQSPSPVASRHPLPQGEREKTEAPSTPLSPRGRGAGGEGAGSEWNTPEKRAAIFIGPEFGTVSRSDLAAAAREAGESGFDVLITCAFNYDAHSSEFNKLGRIPVFKARMNADLHMADDLKNTGKGNLFVIFGEPDISILDTANGQIQVKVNGVDVFHPNTGEVRSDGADGIACWFIDTDYNEESFFVRHAYFLGANDPYKSLKTTLKAEIDPDTWATLNSDTSRPFDKPNSGRIAVKVINHLGDEVMKVFRVD